MESINPFNDPNFQKQILEKEGRYNDSEEIEDCDFEVISDDKSSLKNILSNAPKIPKSVKNTILDASAIAKNEKEAKAAEMSLALNDVFTQYNETYGTDLQIDFSNLSRTLVNVANPETRHLLELYTSEVFRSIRPIMLLHLINRLSLAIDYVLQPERMFDSNSLSTADMFLVIEKLMSYVDQLNNIIETSTIKDSDQILKKISEERHDESLNSSESRQAVEDFMNLLRKEKGLG